MTAKTIYFAKPNISRLNGKVSAKNLGWKSDKVLNKPQKNDSLLLYARFFHQRAIIYPHLKIWIVFCYGKRIKAILFGSLINIIKNLAHIFVVFHNSLFINFLMMILNKEFKKLINFYNHSHQQIKSTT